MTPAKLAKSLGAKSLSEVAAAYSIPHACQLNAIHARDPDRFERMVRVHVMAKQLGVPTQSLDFILESIVGNLQKTNAADYFIERPDEREELTRAYVADFRVRMNDICEQLLLNEQAKSDFREVVYGLLTR
jgi:hypothetical protein